MSFEEFADYIQKNILPGWKESADADIHKVKKNNGVIYTGIYIRENQGTVTPAIYLESYYDRYSRGEDPEELIRDIRCEYDWAMSRTATCQFDISSYQYVRDKLIYRLVNFDRNKDLLDMCPHIRFHDLAVTFRWLAHEDSIGISTALVTDQEMDLWDVTLQDLFGAARKNTKRLFPEKVMMMDHYLQLHGRMIPEDSDGIPMYIATNRQQINGATVIMYDHFLEQFTKEYPGNYYILPSSIHEVIMVPSDRIKDPEELPMIVRHANRTVVSRGEFLSDSIYYYNEDTKSLSIYKTYF